MVVSLAFGSAIFNFIFVNRDELFKLCNAQAILANAVMCITLILKRNFWI